MTRPLSAGDITESRCTRCKAVMNHTIVAMVGQTIVRVQCNTCSSTHNYHPVKPAAAPRTPAARTATKSSGTSAPKRSAGVNAREEWSALLQDADTSNARPYSIDGRYRLNDLVRHPTFGIGIVKRIGEGKVELLFETGTKLLKCA